MFGESVAKKISQHVRAVALELRGFLARPLSVCTASSGSKGEMCMSLASMSQLVKQTEGRQDYRCRKCVENASEREPGSSSSPVRVLHLYALVGTDGHAPTPLHMRPERLVRHLRRSGRGVRVVARAFLMMDDLPPRLSKARTRLVRTGATTKQRAEAFGTWPPRTAEVPWRSEPA